MEYKNIFGIELNYKSISMLALLAILPNLLGMLNLPTVFGFKIHTFQYIVFIAAAIYGPLGGAISGGVGSMFTTFALNNPYIVVGNIILGFVVGFMIRSGWGMIQSVLIAYTIQMPWLYLTDVYLAGMPQALVVNIMIALLISNIVWATVARFTYKPIKQTVQ